MRTSIFVVALLAACNPRSSASVDAAVTTADAAPAPDASAPVEETDEEPLVDAGVTTPCPRPVHPDYCRRACRTWSSRLATKHASRMRTSERVGFGKCGGLDVFAEDEKPGDGGLQSGIVEFFDEHGSVTGAIDTRATCGKFGVVPTCTPQIRWEGSRNVSIKIGTVTATHLAPEVVVRIVRQNYGRFKMCASKGTARPVGRVAAKITIASDGSVSAVADEGSTVPDAAVTSCVLASLHDLAFPQPEGGSSIAHVPIDLAH